MAILRMAAYLLAVVTFVFGVADGARSIAAGELVLLPLSGLGIAVESAGQAGPAPVLAGFAPQVLLAGLAKTVADLPVTLAAFALALAALGVDAMLRHAFARFGRSWLRASA